MAYISKKWGDTRRKTQACKYCKKRGLHFSYTEHGWLLFDKYGDRHNCNKRKLYK